MIIPSEQSPAAALAEFDENRARRIILLLAASVGLMMTGYGVIMPVFARRLEELHSGAATLGLMTMAFAVAQFLLAPFMGGLADRFGRRPLVLVALAGFVVSNVAFLLAQSPTVLIGIRLFEGAITAGLLPAAMAVVGDIVPENQRARWVGIMMGSYGAGFIFGPAGGGFLYDHWGFTAPFAISAGLGVLGFLSAVILIPETRRTAGQSVAAPTSRPANRRANFLATLPRPLSILAVLLLLDFIAVFGFAFVEPRMVFYFYEELAFTTTEFGLIVGAYGLAMVLGQIGLGRLSDRLGRKPMIVAGFGLNIFFYLGLLMVDQFSLIFVIAIVAGLGAAVLAPALSAFYLDITAEEHRSRVLGLKESAAALGGVIGPLLVALLDRWTTPYQVFSIAAGVMVAATILALLALNQSRQKGDSNSRPVRILPAAGPAGD